MSVIGVYDYDFMHYAPDVIPNLECMKYCSYYKEKKDVTVLVPNPVPQQYTYLLVRKDYDDDLYPDYFRASNVIYGGAAFTGMDKYYPLDYRIERCQPDITSYYNFKHLFKTVTEKAIFKKILNSTHLRLSLDGETIKDNYVSQITRTRINSTLIFHDFDLNKLKGSDLVIKDLMKYTSPKSGITRERRIGMKFPVNLNNFDDLNKWDFLLPSTFIFNVQYNGIMSDEELIEFIKKNRSFVQHLNYNITLSPYNEDDFIKNDLPKIFRQVLFLRTTDLKISLIYNTPPNMSKEIGTFLHLLKNWVNSFSRNFITPKWTLYSYVSSDDYKTWSGYTALPLDKVRDSFQYIRGKNYELFTMFYNCGLAKIENGVIIPDERPRYS